MQVTIVFDGQFYIGLFESTFDGKVQLTRHVFGSEPATEEVYEFVLCNLNRILRSNVSSISVTDTSRRIRNPKRIQREAARLLKDPRISTRSQEILKEMQECNKTRKEQVSKQEREAEKERLYKRKRLLAKEKHKGH
ncbi:MAG: YjdF family protein [Ignavibacteria bacterium]|nr:YjdF family protein [Ignavibacteria bacterium]